MAMNAGSLMIDIGANVARLRQDMAEAKQVVGGAARDISQVVGVARGAFLALGAALPLAALTAFVRNTVNGLDALNDLKDATGASIENISALEDVAARTGTSFDTVAASVIKFNKSVSEAKPGSDIAESLKLIGLNADELKKIDPAEALRRTAVALSTYADDGNRARLVQELFGKGVREIAPFLNDLAKQSQLVATVTTEEAEAAEKFNHQLFAMQKNVTDASRTLAGPMISALNETIDKFKEGAKEGKSFYRVIFEEQMKLLGLGPAPAAPDVPAAKRSFRPSDNYGEGYKPSVGGLPDKPAKGKAPKDLGTERARLAAAILAGEEEAAKDVTEAWAAWEKIQLANHKETADATALMWKQWFDEIDAEQERAIEAGATHLGKKTEEMSEFAKEAQRNIQDTFGDTIKRTLKGDFDDIGDLWKNLLLDMASQALAANIGEMLFGNKAGGGGGGLFGSLLGAFAGTGSGTSIDGFAAGGDPPVGRPSLVGEKGPELFVPKSAGTIVPNGEFGGGITLAPTYVNHIDARSDQAQVAAIVQQANAQNNRQLVEQLKAAGRL